MSLPLSANCQATAAITTPSSARSRVESRKAPNSEPLPDIRKVAAVERVHDRADDEGEAAEHEVAVDDQHRGGEVEHEPGHRDRVRRQPRLDQAVAGGRCAARGRCGRSRIVPGPPGGVGASLIARQPTARRALNAARPVSRSRPGRPPSPAPAGRPSAPAAPVPARDWRSAPRPGRRAAPRKPSNQKWMPVRRSPKRRRNGYEGQRPRKHRAEEEQERRGGDHRGEADVHARDRRVLVDEQADRVRVRVDARRIVEIVSMTPLSGSSRGGAVG